MINQAYTIPEETPGYWKENNKLEFFFTIETLDFEVEGTMQDPEAGNQYILIPTPDKKVRYLHVDKEEKIVNLKIYEAGNKLHTGIVKYGDTVTIKVTSRNLVGEELELKVRESVWGSDRKLSEIIKIKIDEEGKGEAPFTIPQGWKNYGDPCTVRKYYLEYKGQEFPRAYYVANPNKTEEENKANSNRVEALMLKVSDDLSLDKKLETENAVTLGEEWKPKENENKNEDTICECEARMRAFMRMIRIGEGTSDEKGYTRFVGGTIKNDLQFNDFSKDMSTHPLKYFEKYDSTAAGAYQITKTNWNDLAFVNWRKIHKINDFSKRSQDIYCAYLIIIKRKAFKLITEGKVKDAIHKCRQEWASFPNSGYGQREEKLDKYQKEFDKYLEEELNDKTTLHVENGFLRKSFYKRCSCKKTIINREKCSNCNSTHIDISDESKWLSQFDPKWESWSKQVQKEACYDTAVQILRNYGLKKGSGTRGINDSNVIQTVIEKNNSIILKNPQEGVNYLNEQLNKGNPVLVGVRHSYKKKELNYDKSTDHYIVIVGKSCEGSDIFYRYFEVGTYVENKQISGVNKNNILILNKENFVIQGDSPNSKKLYTITQVRKNKE